MKPSSPTRSVAASVVLCLCCWWHAVFASTVVVSAFASSSSPSHHLLQLPRSSSYALRKSTAYYMPPGTFISSGREVAAAMQQQHGVLGAATTTRLHLLSIPRGGDATAATTTAAIATTFTSTIITTLTAKLSQWTSTPNGTFNLVLALLGMSTAVLKLYNNNRMMLSNNDNDGERGEESVVTIVKKDPKVKSLQLRFLSVFWLLRMADWLQGPYFYQVYASKTFFGASATAAGSSAVVVSWVSRLFLTGFASTALFGPFVGRMCDSYGRKAGTLAFSLLYSLGAISTKSNVLGVLLLGRVMGGIGTSLLFSAPEAWLVGEAGKEGVEGSLGETFGLAYAGDSIVAILAGQMAGMAASTRGPTGPFELSVGFLVMGAALASFLWKENVAGGGGSTNNDNETKATKDGNDAKPTIRDAIQVVKSDPKIMLVGAIQSLFEAAMYIFVLNWPPAVSKAITSYFAKFSVANSSSSSSATIINTPYGTVFSCFMACCLLGSTIFGQLTSSKKVDKNGKSTAISTETFAVGMLGLAALAMGSATLSISTSTPRIISSLTSLPVLSTILSPIVATCSKLSTSLAQPGAILSILMLSLFLFESCVGMYFPTIGTLRSKFFPDSHRSVVMNLFGIPLNVMVVSVFLSIERLGVQGALGVSTTALAVAAACGYKLKRLVKDSDSK